MNPGQWLYSSRMTKGPPANRVELRHVEALHAIAAAGSITAAAARLFISQPALSRTLSQLESILGVVLVDRNTHSLELTPVGRTFIEHTAGLSAMLTAAIDAARASERAVRVAYPWATNQVVAELLSCWEARVPTVRIELHYDENARDRLLAGQADLALVRAETSSSLRTVTLGHDARWAALPHRHRLTKRRSLVLADLRNDTIVVSTHGTTRLTMWPSEVRPERSVMTDSTDAWLLAIARGQGVGVTVTSIANSRPHPQIVYLPITDAEPVPLQLARRANASNPVLAQLQRHATSIRRPT
jgi:DNA-binding transcriptional LysR family regulator